jgi:hypothetical protein
VTVPRDANGRQLKVGQTVDLPAIGAFNGTVIEVFDHAGYVSVRWSRSVVGYAWPPSLIIRDKDRSPRKKSPAKNRKPRKKSPARKGLGKW